MRPGVESSRLLLPFINLSVLFAHTLVRARSIYVAGTLSTLGGTLDCCSHSIEAHSRLLFACHSWREGYLAQAVKLLIRPSPRSIDSPRR